MGKKVWIGVALILSVVAPRETHAFSALDTTNCSYTGWPQKLQVVAEYMKTAASTYRFQTCMDIALRQGGLAGQAPMWMVHDESSSVGHYVPCTWTLGSTTRSDNATFSSYPSASGVLGAIGSANPLVISCPAALEDWGGRALYQYEYGHIQAEEILLNSNTVLSRFPGHQPFYFGPFDPTAPSTPTDELAGILLHEILHTHDFEHGDLSHLCWGYASWDCSGGWPCRMSTLPEIAEACMSAVIEESQRRCAVTCPAGFRPYPFEAYLMAGSVPDEGYGTEEDPVWAYPDQPASCYCAGPLLQNNLAHGKPATQSSTYQNAFAWKGNDLQTYGTCESGAIACTNFEANPYWEVDLQQMRAITRVEVYNRTDCCGDRLKNWQVFVSADHNTWTSIYADGVATGAPAYTNIDRNTPLYTTQNMRGRMLDRGTWQGRYVRVRIAGQQYLQLADVVVSGF